jgi:type VI secretion system protein
MRRTFFLKLAACGIALAMMTGCSTVTGAVKGAVNKAMNFVTFKGTLLAWKEVVIAAVPGANQNSPVAVDVVMVLDEATLEKIAALPAPKWFQTRADMLRTFPGTYIYKSWEVSPGQTLRLRGDAFGTPSVVGVFVFADYLSPGEHRMRVEQLQDGIIIELGVRGFTVSPYKAE